MRWRRLHQLILLIFLSPLTVAAAREAAPQFTARTLGGETFTNGSLRGQVVLLQFWTTWCPVCRSQQAALDNIIRDFTGEGLVVIAVDVHEDGQTVKEYLAEHPRSCHIVLTEDTDLVAAFAPKSFPTYVLIDRDGTIAENQAGGGDLWIRNVLSRAGLGRSSAKATDSRGQRSSVHESTHPVSPKLIEIPAGPSTPPPKPRPPTVFVLRSGEKLEAHHYTIMGGSVRIAEHGDQRTIPLAALDLKASIAANHARGIELKIPTSPTEIVLGL
jgi:thiol-disulfide isomerase/thioredoxin